MDRRNGPGPESKDPSDRNFSKPGEASNVAHYSGCLRSFLQEVSATLEKLKQEVPGLDLSTKKRPEEILAHLPKLLEFEQMSLLEVQYLLPETSKRPGIRFWLEGPRTGKRLRAVLFKDTVVWDVSYSLEKLYTELGTFRLEGTGILAQLSSAVPGGRDAGSDWRVALRAVLRTPLLCPHV
jgi:hypothetical protein